MSSPICASSCSGSQATSGITPNCSRYAASGHNGEDVNINCTGCCICGNASAISRTAVKLMCWCAALAIRVDVTAMGLFSRALTWARPSSEFCYSCIRWNDDRKCNSGQLTTNNRLGSVNDRCIVLCCAMTQNRVPNHVRCSLQATAYRGGEISTRQKSNRGGEKPWTH